MVYRRMPWGLLLFAAAAQAATSDTAPSLEHCASMALHGQRARAEACYRSLTQSADPYLRAEGDWGLERYEEANAEFRTAVARVDGSALYRVRWGRLLHERFNDTDAVQLFQEALQRDPRSAQAYLGLALVSAQGFDDKAQEYLDKALSLDPSLVAARVLLAELELEDADVPQATAAADMALRLDPEA